MKNPFWIVLYVSTIATSSAFAAQGGPPAGGGGGGQTTLSDLGCGLDEVARVNSNDEWECTNALTTTESLVSTAQFTADGAVTDAATAQLSADAAASAAAAAQVTADNAAAGAATAQSTADTAVSDAAAAQSTANLANTNALAAQGAAAGAQSTANQAVIDAEAAQSTASSAELSATAAQNTADNARTTAETAFSTANNAEQAAASAQSSADQLIESVILNANAIDVNRQLVSLLQSQNLDSRITANATNIDGINQNVFGLVTAVDTLQGQNLDSRISDIEIQNLGDRLADLESSATGLNLTSTIVVSPVGPTALDNGTALVNAVAEATNRFPNPDNPVAIKLEPGLYDVGTATLDLPSYVALTGAGRKITTIRGGGSSDAIVRLGFAGAGEYELSGLTIESYGNAGLVLRTGRVEVSAYLHDLTFDGEVIFDVLSGYFGPTVLRDVEFGSNDLLNISGDSDHAVIVESMMGGSISVIGSTLRVQNSLVGGVSADQGAQVFISQSTLDGSSIVPWSVIANRSASVKVSDSRILRSLNTEAQDGLAGNIYVATSEVDASIVQNGGPITCVFSYGAALNPLGAGCL